MEKRQAGGEPCMSYAANLCDIKITCGLGPEQLVSPRAIARVTGKQIGEEVRQAQARLGGEG